MSVALALALAVGDVVLVLPVRAGATIGAELRRDLQATLEDGFSRGTLEPVRDAEADACGDDACVRARAQGVRATYVLRASVEEADRNFAIDLVLLDATTLQEVARSSRECEVCGSAEVLEVLADQAAALTRRPAVERPAMGVLVLRSDPSGADVAIDGDGIGRTPARREVPPGGHRVVFAMRGRATVTRDVAVVEGVEEVLAVELPRERSAMRIAGGVVLGVGLAAVGAGAGLLAVDGRPHRDRCSGDDVDFAGRCRFSLETTAGGAAAVAVGGAAIAIAIGLLVAARKH